MGKVYLVGAGPGDLDLLTLRAVRMIQKADVLLYDRLVNPDILGFASRDCELVYVGKEDGRHTIPQEEINQLLWPYSQKKEAVVRLKGGDPFVFGRGGEEALFLIEKGVSFEVVPGISSSIAAPAYGGIPVTHRGVASSFAVITGHECPHKKNSTLDWESFRGIHTLVFLMGVHRRKAIAEKLIQVGRKIDESVAFVQEGTTAHQKVFLTTLGELASGKGPEVASPEVMVVGEVVKLHKKLEWFTGEKLSNASMRSRVLPKTRAERR